MFSGSDRSMKVTYRSNTVTRTCPCDEVSVPRFFDIVTTALLSLIAPTFDLYYCDLCQRKRNPVTICWDESHLSQSIGS
jgi:hypothetical protein